MTSPRLVEISLCKRSFILLMKFAAELKIYYLRIAVKGKSQIKYSKYRNTGSRNCHFDRKNLLFFMHVVVLKICICS